MKYFTSLLVLLRLGNVLGQTSIESPSISSDSNGSNVSKGSQAEPNTMATPATISGGTNGSGTSWMPMMPNVPGTNTNTMKNFNNMQNLNVGNPDNGRIERPCPNLDIDCIRRYFHEHGQCKIVRGPVPDPLIRKKAINYLPNLNVTITFGKGNELRGLNGVVQEFYINRDTDKVLIAIDFRKIYIYSKNTYLRFHRRGKEPVITKDYSYGDIGSIVTTATIPQINDIQLDKMTVFAFINNGFPALTLGPGLMRSTDPVVTVTIQQLMATVPTVLQEFFTTDAALYPAVFIQKNICDFGIPLLI